MYKKVKNIIKHGRETLTPKKIIDSLKSKEMAVRAEINKEKLKRFTKLECLKLGMEKGKIMVARRRVEVTLNHKER